MPENKSRKQKSHKSTLASAKKAIVLGGAESKHKPAYVLLGLTFLALTVAGLVVWATGPSDNTVSMGVTQAANATEVRFSVSAFDDGQARHYEHRSGDLTVRYFVLKSADGVVRAAFDACDVCWPAGKGYVQEGNEMICRNCGRRLASVRINEVKGGCNPAPLRRAIDGDQLVIQVADIEAGRNYFNFKREG